MRQTRIAVFVKNIFIVSTLLLSGCDYVTEQAFNLVLEPSPPATPKGAIAHRDIVFSKTPQRELMLDVYQPEAVSEKPLPVILFLFGGGWNVGNRHQLTRFGLEDYALQGFAVVTADYRYSSEAIFPAQIQDVIGAIDWIRSSAQEYGFDANRIGVVGPSAGGHLSALAGTANRPGELAFDEATKNFSGVQAVVDYYGPTDFLQGDAHRMEDAEPWNAADSSVSRLMGAPIETVPERVETANPITYIDGSEPPFLILHGDKDALVPLHQSEILHQALLAAGVQSELIVVKDGDHGYSGEFFTEMPGEAMLAFFKDTLQN
jgi:acetyl esterase/lipase